MPGLARAAVRGALLTFCALVLVGGAATAQAAPPQVDPPWATDVSTTSALLHAEINPAGKSTSYRFEYLTLAAYEANLKASREGFAGAVKTPTLNIGAGVAPVSVASRPSGLKAETSYRYRVFAESPDGPTPSAERVFLTRALGSALKLLDNRGWEMVSPADKNGGEVQGLGPSAGGALLQAAPDGEGVSFGSASSFAGGGGGAPAVSRYISRRQPGGWSVENLTVPQLSGSYGAAPNVDPYRFFSTDLAAALLSNGQRCRDVVATCPVANPPLAGSGAPAGYRNYYLRNGGGYRALLDEADVAALALEAEDFELAFAGATADLRHVLLSTCAALTPPATEVPGVDGECDLAATNLYLWSAGGLSLVNLLPAATEGTPGASLAAPNGAVASDGSRVYWTVGGNLYLREGGTLTRQVDAAVGGGGAFETASADGSLAFFTKAGHLYRYEAAGAVVADLTPSGDVEGVLGASEDGSDVYFLTGAGLFLRAGAITVQVAASADPSNYPPATATARVSPDGSHLAFLAKASLTGYDNVGQASGMPESQVYLYDAGADELVCASCNPTLARPLGPSTIPGATVPGAGADAIPIYEPRSLSADGRRLFFDSADALVAQDTNNRPDVYEWEAAGAGSCQRPGGCLNLISSGRSAEGASFADAAADGSDVFFLTDGSLVPSDAGSVDLYDAREGGGFPVAPKPIPCDGDSCQPLPSPPDDPPIGTAVPGAANPPVAFPRNKAGQKKSKKARGKKAKGKKRDRGRR